MLTAMLVDRTTQFLGWLNRNRRVQPGPDPVRVVLGSALNVAPGWIHVDGFLSAFFAKWPTPVLGLLYRLTSTKQFYSQEQYVDVLKGHNYVHHQLRYGVPFLDNSVDCIYSSHLIEHFYLDQARALLVEACRVLKPGSRIRLCVPDLEHVLALYRAGEKEKAMSYLFADSRSRDLARHRYMYDFHMLRQLLEASGFAAVERCSYRQGRMPDIDILDNRPEETLYVEAIKPGRANLG